MREYGVDYVIIEALRCEFSPHAGPGTFREMFNFDQPQLVKEPPMCMRWLIGDSDRKTAFFSIVHVNEHFMVSSV
jgi:hypothetical protein